MILIALGANLDSRLGPPDVTLEATKACLESQKIEIKKSSSIWLTEPVPTSDQPWYRNAVISVQTVHNAQDLLRILKATEKDFGRTSTQKNAARILDLDILAYNKQIIDTPSLSLPHPRLYERGFVLYPLCEIAPGWVHPVLNKTALELKENLPGAQRVKLMQKVAV